MGRKILLWFLASILLTAAAAVEAQQAGKVFRIGLLDHTTAIGMAGLVDAFRQELSKLGWVEGKNITIEYRFGESKGSEHFRKLAAELVRLKVDLIVVTTTTTAIAAKEATATIPIVMTNPGDPVRAGLVKSLAAPGGNVTGLSSLGPELNTKRLEILKDVVPKLTRVGLLRQPAGAGGGIISDIQLQELRPAAVALNVKLEEIETRPEAKALESAFQTAKQKKVNAILTTASQAYFAHRTRIVELATKHRFPAIYFQKEFVDAGGLMSYGVDFIELYRRAAHHVDKILKGAKPADIPVEQAMKFEFIISLPAAKKIGFTVPYELLARANQVIK